jgi:hypothetical protein
MGRRRTLIAAAAALVPAVLVLTGCEAGVNAPVLNWHQPTDGTTELLGNITVINAFVLGAPLGTQLQPGQSAGLFLSLSNSGARDSLIRISAPGVATSVTLPQGQVPVGPRPVLLTGPQPQVVLDNLLGPLSGGSVVKLFLTFQNGGTFKLVVPVMPQAQYYSSFSPAPSPSPSASPAASPGRHKHH